MCYCHFYSAILPPLRTNSFHYYFWFSFSWKQKHFFSIISSKTLRNNTLMALKPQFQVHKWNRHKRSWSREQICFQESNLFPNVIFPDQKYHISTDLCRLICCLMEVYLTPGFSEAYFLLLHHSRSHEFWQLFFEISFFVITLRMWRVVDGWKMPVISTFHISTSTVSFLRGAQTIEGSGEINCNFTTYLVSFLKKKSFQQK